MNASSHDLRHSQIDIRILTSFKSHIVRFQKRRRQTIDSEEVESRWEPDKPIDSCHVTKKHPRRFTPTALESRSCHAVAVNGTSRQWFHINVG